MNTKGFTLIELLVVVLIIGILSSVALPQYTKAVEKSRAVEAKTVLGNLMAAETVYHLSVGSYTSDLTVLDISIPGLTSSNRAQTKNFNISTMSSGATCFVGIAERANNGVKVTGANGYSLFVAPRANGTVERICSGSTDMCKIVTDGRVCSSSSPSEDWCYSLATPACAA